MALNMAPFAALAVAAVAAYLLTKDDDKDKEAPGAHGGPPLPPGPPGPLDMTNVIPRSDGTLGVSEGAVVPYFKTLKDWAVQSILPGPAPGFELANLVVPKSTVAEGMIAQNWALKKGGREFSVLVQIHQLGKARTLPHQIMVVPHGHEKPFALPGNGWAVAIGDFSDWVWLSTKLGVLPAEWTPPSSPPVSPPPGPPIAVPPDTPPGTKVPPAKVPGLIDLIKWVSPGGPPGPPPGPPIAVPPGTPPGTKVPPIGDLIKMVLPGGPPPGPPIAVPPDTPPGTKVPPIVMPPPPPSPPSGPPDFSRDIRAVQSELNFQGFDAGAVDGDFGPRTRRALMNFQATRGIEPHGSLDGPTQAALYAAWAGHGGRYTSSGYGARRTAGPLRISIDHQTGRYIYS